MTQFSSKLPFNDDPLPWLRRHPELGYMGRFESRFPNDTHSDYQMKHSPRPEFNRPQHNPTNPILVEMLSEIPEYGFNVTAELAWLDREGLFWGNYPSGAREHAIKVLSKWKAVFG